MLTSSRTFGSCWYLLSAGPVHPTWQAVLSILCRAASLVYWQAFLLQTTLNDFLTNINNFTITLSDKEELSPLLTLKTHGLFWCPQTRSCQRLTGFPSTHFVHVQRRFLSGVEMSPLTPGVAKGWWGEVQSLILVIDWKGHSPVQALASKCRISLINYKDFFFFN